MDIRRILKVLGRIALIAILLTASGVLLYGPDGDNVWTHEELRHGTNPLAEDTDGDAISDRVELEHGSVATDQDSDDDGLSDTIEYRGRYSDDVTDDLAWVREFDHSDPMNPDTDGDGLQDGPEYEAGLDPTSPDSDGDGFPDHEEQSMPTDAANPDTDGDTLRDNWEIEERTDKGAKLPGADPLHKDIYLHALYLRGVDHETPSQVFEQSRDWFAGMPVHNPDGETGIRLHPVTASHTNRSIDEWTKSNGETTAGVSGFMAMREFYNQETIGPRTGSYFLVVFPSETVPVRGSGNAGGAKVSIVRPWPGSRQGHVETHAHIITHEVLHNIARRVGDNDCNGQMHTCAGFLSYENQNYLSDVTAKKLNTDGFADPVYPEQMNATSCEDTINDPTECGT